MNHRRLSEETNAERITSKTLVNHRVIKILSIIIIILGVVSIGVGVASLAISLIVRCEFPYQERHYNRYSYRITSTTSSTTTFTRLCAYQRTFSSPGLWCGAMYITTGIIGILASRRRTVCFVVTLMALTVVSNWVSLSGMVLSIGSHFDREYNQLNDYPLSLHILNSLVTLTSLIVFIIQWVVFGYTSHAACCDGRKGYPKMKKTEDYHYRALAQSQPVTMHPNQVVQPPPVTDFLGPATSYHVPMELPQHGSDAVYLVKDRQVIGVLPQNLIGQQILQFNNAGAAQT